jgi:ankyrin repeat protein
MFEPGNDHLELLLEFGLGTGDGGPWRRRLGDALDSPAEMVRGELGWAITHGLADRVRLLVSHGVEVAAPFDDGVTVTSMAATTGHPELIDYLVEHGAPAPELAPADAFVAAVEFLAELGFDVNARGRTDVPSDQPWQTALHKAAEDGNLELARTLLRLGADPDIRDQRFDSTPLGWARYFGRPALIELLESVTQPDTQPDTVVTDRAE